MAYNENTWQDGDVITASGMNNMEGGIKANDTAITTTLPATIPASASESGGTISFKNSGGTTLFTVALPVYSGGVS